jgi:zinc/manganese transport system substrate-binding protein
MKRRAQLVLFLSVMVIATGCGGDSRGDRETTVVATTTILGDVVSKVVGDDASVIVLTPIGADPHDFQPSAAQVAAINEADLVVANGLLLEEGMDDVLDAAVGDGVAVLEIAPLLDPLPFGFAVDHDEEGDHGEGSWDPHVWFDPVRMADAARQIAAALASINPEMDWEARAESYAVQLLAADEEVATTLSGIAPNHRLLVTNHDSLGYFADRYGFEVVGVVIPGGSTLADPSSAELAELIEEMKDTGVTAIFGETTQPGALAEAVAAELGSTVQVVSLYTGSLGEPGSGAESLIGMLTTNADRIADALG